MAASADASGHEGRNNSSSCRKYVSATENVRPYESLGMKTHDEMYSRSKWIYTEKIDC